MSGVAIAVDLLMKSPSVTALVPRARIVAGMVQQGTQPPYISVTDIVGTERKRLRKTATSKVTDVVQVTVVGANYPQMKKVIGQVRAATREYVGAAGGFEPVTCSLDNRGPDFQNTEGLFAQTQDLRITFDEPVS